MDWDKLRIFHTVAKAKSFTEAGEMLNLSQSAVSRQISTLEESLDMELFHRHARGLILTEQGEILKNATDEIAQKLKSVEGRLTDTKESAEGPLVVTVSDFIGSTWLTPGLSVFRDLYPQIQLTLIFDERVLNLNMREADVAIRLHEPQQPDLVGRKLTTINFHICASKNYLQKYGTPKTLRDLKDHCLLAFPPGSLSPIQEPGWLINVANINTEHNNNVLLMNSMYAIHKAVQTDVGIAVLPNYMIDSRDNLQILLPEYQRPPVDMFFVYAEERRNSKRIKIFRDFLLEKVSKTPF
ncbi:MAG: LysR family transcriptional regulator [Alphaproteobacteria bacterium]|nr:LysR family transcriptional regulator [Alphaproteobacteria bacterium]